KAQIASASTTRSDPLPPAVIRDDRIVRSDAKADLPIPARVLAKPHRREPAIDAEQVISRAPANDSGNEIDADIRERRTGMRLLLWMLIGAVTIGGGIF